MSFFRIYILFHFLLIMLLLVNEVFNIVLNDELFIQNALIITSAAHYSLIHKDKARKNQSIRY
jgi:hypothetical protein